MNKYVKYFLCALVFSLAFVAVSSDAAVFDTITSRLKITFQSVRTVIFVVGGFGLIGLGFAAIFGKIKWPWLAALACGLAIVALAGSLVDYVTQESENVQAPSAALLGGEFQDTLLSGGGE